MKISNNSGYINGYSDMSNKLIPFLGISAYIWIFFVLTDLRLGGDFKYFLPYLSFFTSAAILLSKPDYGIFRSHLFHALAAYVLISYLLIPLSISPNISLLSLNKEVLSGFFLFFTLHIYIIYSKKIELTIYFLIFMLFLLILLGYFSFSSGIIDVEIKLIKFKLQHNEYAWTLNILLPFVIAATLYIDNRLIKYSVISLLIISIFAIFMSLSRGGWMSLIMTFFLWSVYLVKGSRRFLASWVMFWLGLSIIILMLWVVSPSFKARVFSTTEDIKSITGRTSIWERNIKAIKNSPIVGWGYGNRIVWDEKPFVVRKGEGKDIFSRIGAHAHSMVLHILFHQGIVGFLFFMYLMLVSFISIGSAIKRSNCNNREQKLYYAVLCVFISVFIIHGSIEVIPFNLICLMLGFFSGINGAVDRDT